MARDKATLGPTLNEILVADGVDREALTIAADEYYERPQYGSFLVDKGLVTNEKLSVALAKQAAIRQRYEEAFAHLRQAAEIMHRLALDHLDAIQRETRFLTGSAK